MIIVLIFYKKTLGRKCAETEMRKEKMNVGENREYDFKWLIICLLSYICILASLDA